MHITAAKSYKKVSAFLIKSTNRFPQKLLVRNQRGSGYNISDLLRMPANIYWKNSSGYYLGCNDSNAKASGMHTRSDVIGAKISNFAEENNARLVEETDSQVV